MLGLGWVGKDHIEHRGKIVWMLPILLCSVYILSQWFSLCFFCSYIANQKRLEIINEDDVEAYVGLKNL